MNCKTSHNVFVSKILKKDFLHTKVEGGYDSAYRKSAIKYCSENKAMITLL